VVVFFLLFAYAFRVVWWPENISNDQTIIGNTSFRHPLTGVLLSEEISLPQVFGVMVENSADAWPLSGIDEAFLVIEAPVEADIPRLIAFFDTNQSVEQIGPVRSARPYYLDWAKEFDAMYEHVGGSPEALELINENNIFDLNEFWNGQYFWRSSGRAAPHNTYTSSELLNKALVAKQENAPELNYGLWNFKNDSPTENFSDSDLVIGAKGSTYEVNWKYNQENNNYVRWLSGVENKVENGNKIFANNVAVVYTVISVIDNVGRREIETVGQGEALVLQDGKKITTVWKKESADDRLRFYTEDGKEISWNAGQTWIEVVSTLDK